MRVLALIALLVGCALGYPETTPNSAALQPADGPRKAASPGGSKAPPADEHKDDPRDEEDQTPVAGLDPADGAGDPAFVGAEVAEPLLAELFAALRQRGIGGPLLHGLATGPAAVR